MLLTQTHTTHRLMSKLMSDNHRTLSLQLYCFPMIQLFLEILAVGDPHALVILCCIMDLADPNYKHLHLNLRLNYDVRHIKYRLSQFQLVSSIVQVHNCVRQTSRQLMNLITSKESYNHYMQPFLPVSTLEFPLRLLIFLCLSFCRAFHGVYYH